MLRTRARTSLVALAAAAALVTAGCGVDQADGAALNATGGGLPTAPQGGGGTIEPGRFEGTGGVVFLQQAADATASMDSMRTSMTIEMTGIPLMGSMSIQADGAIDTENELMQMTMDMGDMFGALDQSAGPDLSGEAGVIEMVVDGDTTYMRSPIFSMLPGADSSKSWYEAPTDDVSDSETFSQSTSDPKDFLEFLRNSGNEVTEVGVEELRGVETTHLKTVLDPENLAENASEEEREEMEESISDLGASGITEIPIEVWVDADGMVRKIMMTMDMAGAAEAASDDDSELTVDMSEAQVILSIEMYDFGEPVDIEVPDPSDVQPMPSEMLGG